MVENKPNFICVGFPRCGTTTLYEIMVQHKDLYFSGIKEPIYYHVPSLYKKGFKWYTRRYYGKKKINNTIGEINPELSKAPIAQKIHNDFGDDLKIIFIVRNPVTRLFSDYKLKLTFGICFKDMKKHLNENYSESFDEYVKLNFKGQRMEGKNLQNSFLAYGEYSNTIKDYYKYYKQEQIKIILFEDLIKKPKEISQQIFEFIGVEPSDSINYNIDVNKSGRIPKSVISMKLMTFWLSKIWKRTIIKYIPYVSNDFCKFLNKITWSVPKLLTKKEKVHYTISTETKNVLQEYYRKEKEEMEKILDRDLSEIWYK